MRIRVCVCKRERDEVNVCLGGHARIYKCATCLLYGNATVREGITRAASYYV